MASTSARLYHAFSLPRVEQSVFLKNVSFITLAESAFKLENTTSGHIGIDFGAKRSGNTVLFYLDAQGEFKIARPLKGQDADTFILDHLQELGYNRVYIDAPLTLPIGYFSDKGDLMMRACDRSLSAMSPMFLGGLTARAIQLKRNLEAQGLIVMETYPAALVRQLKFQHYIKKAKAPSVDLHAELEQHLPSLRIKLEDMHAFDAALAWLSGKRHLDAEAVITGNPQEGIIVV